MPRTQVFSRYERHNFKYFWVSLQDMSRIEARIKLILIPDRRAIVAFPGSGSRWIRSMIASGTGIIIERGKGRYDNLFKNCYRVHNETECKNLRRNLPETKSQNIIVFTHMSPRKSNRFLSQFSCPKILLIRNPYHAIISSYQHHVAGINGYIKSESKLGKPTKGLYPESVFVFYSETACSRLTRF